MTTEVSKFIYAILYRLVASLYSIASRLVWTYLSNFTVTIGLFVFLWITAELICVKFIYARRIWSLAWTSFNVKVKGQGHQGQIKHSHHPRQRRNGTRSLHITSRTSRRDHSVAAGVFSAACVRFVFGKILSSEDSVKLVVHMNLCLGLHLKLRKRRCTVQDRKTII